MERGDAPAGGISGAALCFDTATPIGVPIVGQPLLGLMLLFKKKFLEAIRTGRKTQTVRVWKRRYVRAGQISYIPGVGRIRILAIDEVDLDELDEQDARRDGFESAAQLVSEIRDLYRERLVI